MNRKILVGFVLPAVAALLVSSCSGEQEAEHNAADVTFAEGMIPHHRQAVEMSSDVPAHTANPQVRSLAEQIGRAQQPEIDQLTRWLTDWAAAPSGNPVTGNDDPGHRGMDHGDPGGNGMSGMVDTAGLDRLRDGAFDRRWLELMVRHHTGAVGMARTELAQGRDAGAKAMARRIVDTQQAEIATMRGMLG
ncbi:DUF305 domain-containing protein [Amycolatopsis ultiminotia]|uniref:DUF305 domain-containing protein n=1 Tax=Amycolatopsis ultiminotia TaxID=543629 RepID=A0ABP6VYI3_9PSEU